MALTQCSDCNAEISEDASTCPSCGAELQNLGHHIKGCLIISLVLGGFMFLMYQLSQWLNW